MSKNQKEWFKEKREKGKEWIKNHKFFIGGVAGIILTTTCRIAVDKIMEPKEMSVQTLYNPEIEDENFMIRVSGENRFGKRTYHSPWVRYEYGIKDKERIDNAIMAAINREENKEF